MRRAIFLVPLLLVSLLFLAACGIIFPPLPLPEEPYAAPFDPEAITVDPATGAEIVSNQVIVRFREGLANTVIEAVIAGLGCIIVGEIPMLNVYQLRIPDGAHPADLVAQFERSPHVQWAQVSYIARLNAPTGIASEPNDRYFWKQWALHNIDAPEAWAIEKGHPRVTIAILDTGVNYTHEDLKDNLRMDRFHYWDQIDFDRSPMDEQGHGTAMAGVAVARMNDRGIVGVAPYATFLPVRVLSAGDPTFEPAAVKFAVSVGMLFAYLDAEVKVINMSLGSTGRCRLEEEVVAILSGKNDVLLIAGAGNDGSTSEFFPAALPGVMAVAATDHNDQRSVWLRGFWPLWRAGASNYGPWVDVSAPGGSTLGIIHPERQIRSTGLRGYGWTGGTSAATAFVSGVAALIWSLDYRDGYFHLSASDVWDIIVDTADNIDHLNPRYRGKLGTGRVNAHRALLEVKRRLGLHQPPTATITSPRDGSTFPVGTSITFRGSATDPEDGTLTDDSLLWIVVCKEWRPWFPWRLLRHVAGKSSFTLSDLPVGSYSITFRATDSAGATGEASVTIIVQGQQDPEVTFPDPNLERVIRDAIDKPTGPIFRSDLIGLTHLDAHEENISDLTGIEYLTNLTELWLCTNQITDISPLAGLTNLTKLCLRVNQISDISPLAGLTNLTELGLSSNRINDLAPLAANTGLGAGDEVFLRGNPLDLTPGSQNMRDIAELRRRGVRVYV